MPLETEKFMAKREHEQSRETKEKEADKELQAAAAMERADYLVREVQTNQNKMKNILIHIQQVKQLIQQLQAQLNISSNDNPASVVQDEKQAAALKKRIDECRSELLAMEHDLVREKMAELKAEFPHAALSEIEEQAKKYVEKMMKSVLRV